MKHAGMLEQLVGGRWHGISFVDDEKDMPDGVEVRQLPRFCEAVKLAVVHPMAIKPSEFTCPGARYAFGGMVDLKETMIDKMSESKGYSREEALRLFENTPHLPSMPEMIGFDCGEEPDILVAQLQPEQAMRLLRLYHVKLGGSFQTEISSVISACGNTVIRALEKQDMALSFGCEDSRAFGGLTRDRLYVGIPYSLAEKLVR